MPGLSFAPPTASMDEEMAEGMSISERAKVWLAANGGPSIAN